MVFAVTIAQILWPPWTTTILWTCCVVVTGWVVHDQADAERAFGGSAILTLATLMLASHVLAHSALYAALCARAHRLPMWTLTAAALLLSSVLNNIPVYLAIAPVLRAKALPPWTLVHLSHACALGGLLTPLGTSSHFIANDLLQDLGVARLGLADFARHTPLGVALGYVGSFLACRHFIRGEWPLPKPAQPPFPAAECKEGAGGQGGSKEVESGESQRIGRTDASRDEPGTQAQCPRSSWVGGLLVLWVVFSLLQDTVGASQWVVSGTLLASMLALGLTNREAPWTHFRGQTLAFTALSTLLGLGVRDSGLGDAIRRVLDAAGDDKATLRWTVLAVAVLLLTQVMHNSIVISVFIPSLYGEPRSVLVAVTALASLSLCLATGYPLNELVLEHAGLPPKTLVAPGLCVAACTLCGFFALRWA